MTPIEIIALIFAILVLVKLLFVLFKPRAWMAITAPLYKNAIVSTIIYVVLAAIVGYYIFSTFGIVQVAAIILFAALLLGIGFAAYPRIMLGMKEEALREGRGKAWLTFIIWAAIAIWTLVAIFA